ncbi:MAG: DUF3137 domain-containing protein [Clostridium sp.]|nr:DUF3137 domain-containing protein [Clostridium sp.]MCM1207898.1 DUF3137 domain-containing protein [Ruminococcus sp.]
MNQKFEGNKSDREIVSVISSRQRLLKLLNIVLVIDILSIFICPICGFMIWERNPVRGITFVALAAVFVLLCVFLGKSTRKLEAKIKELTGQYIVKDVLAEKIDIVEYSPNRYINEKFVKNCAILPDYNKIHGSDYISGSYRGRKFIYCDLLLEWESKDSDGDTTTTTLFQGHLMKMELGKNIGGFVRIRERKNPRKSNGFFANVLGVGVSPDSIETENVKFNNQFKIKTSDDQLAFYILTPQFMESVMRLDELADGYTNIEFRDTSVVVTLNTGRDSFEIKKTLGSKRLLEKYRQSFREELEVLLGVFDEILTKDNLF